MSGYMQERAESANTQRAAGLRGTTEDERWLLHHIGMWGSDGYPIRKLGNKWGWGPVRSIKGPPIVFRTRREAVESFERFLDILRDALAGRV